MTPILAFDIETVPDVAGIRKLYELPADLPDREVAEVAFQKRRTRLSSWSILLPIFYSSVAAIETDINCLSR